MENRSEHTLPLQKPSKTPFECDVSGPTSALMNIFCPDQGFGDPERQLSEETRRLLRFRLFAVGSLLMIAVLLFSTRSYLVDSFLGPSYLVSIPILAICIAVLFRRKDLSLRTLRGFEVLLFGIMTVNLILHHLLFIIREETGPDLAVISVYRAAISFFAIIIVFGFFIPNNWKQAVVTSSGIALAPILGVVASWQIFPEIKNKLEQALTVEHVSYTAMIIFIAMLSSVIGSHVIDMMRTRTRKIRETGMYQLKEKIGFGGMGEVWKAEHRLLARPAAIKVIRPEILGSTSPEDMEKIRERFKREAQITASLRSPHTIELYDFGITQNGSFYYVMEYLRGLDLDQLVTKYGPLPPERVIHLLRQAADSLGEAHQSGLIHRDIKPSNLFITRMGLQSDFLKVLDFGLVKRERRSLNQESNLTNEGITTGTPAFMAPELGLGKKEIDIRSDIYALGCVGYWLLTGLLVFEGSTPMEILVEHVKSPPVPPSRRTEIEIPPQLDELILACLQKDPDKRPQNMAEFLRYLNECNCRPWTPEKADGWWKTHLPNVA